MDRGYLLDVNLLTMHMQRRGQCCVNGNMDAQSHKNSHTHTDTHAHFYIRTYESIHNLAKRDFLCAIIVWNCQHVVCTHTQTQTHTHTDTQAHTDAHTDAHTHTHTHTHHTCPPKCIQTIFPYLRHIHRHTRTHLTPHTHAQIDTHSCLPSMHPIPTDGIHTSVCIHATVCIRLASARE